LAEWQETDDEFEARMVKLTMQAARKGVPEALRKLSSWYYNGEYVAKDRAEAARLMLDAKAIEAKLRNPLSPN
jgi:TPR repeat protein